VLLHPPLAPAPGGLSDGVSGERRGDEHEDQHEPGARHDVGVARRERGQEHEDDRGTGHEPGRVDLVEDLRHAQEAEQADGREQEAQHEQRHAERVEQRARHQNGRPRVTYRATTRVAVNESSASASAASM
jgi:hypothetical protein